MTTLHYTNDMRLILVCTFLLVSTMGFSQNNWRLIYENDAEGRPITGSLDALISAVQNGEMVRIYFKMGRVSEPDFFVEHTATAKYFTIMNSPKGRFVTAQIDPIVGQIPDFDKEQVLLKENLEWSLIASSNGQNDTMTRNVINGEIINHRIYRWGTRWFVQME